MLTRIRIFWIIPLALTVGACGSNTLAPHVGGRYQQVSNPPAIFCPATNGNTMPEPGCGVMILDTETGNLFIHRPTDWQEENPHTGKITLHDLN
jgi:hypothetical protein